MVKPTASSRLLAAVSVAQLATGIAGMAVALRRSRDEWLRSPPFGS